MASSDGLDEDCVLHRGRSHSDPSSITEIRLGEAHGAGKKGGEAERVLSSEDSPLGQVVGLTESHGGLIVFAVIPQWFAMQQQQQQQQT